MAKKNYLRNEGKHWTPEEVAKLRQLAKGNTPTRVIGFKMGRPVAGVQAKASEKRITLNPPNQKPYNRRK